MPRPHIEFIQSQNLDWQPTAAFGAADIAEKRLCTDDDGALTTLVRVPAGAALRRQGAAWDEELYVLDGELRIAGIEHPRHTYAYVPATHRLAWHAGDAGATLLYWRHPHAAGDGIELVVVRSMEMPWDTTMRDGNLVHLRLARKTLRIGPDRTRTYLLAGLPHGYPENGLAGMEKHPHPEEMFLVSGDMWSPQGRMTRGAYFYRPPEIWHGNHWSELGFLMVMRNPGASFPITQWSDERSRVQQDNPFQPDLPDSAPPDVRRPYVGIVDF